MIIAGFDWDDGNWPKCGKHGPSQEDVERVLDDDAVVLVTRHEPHAESRFLAFGQLDEIYVMIVFTIRARDGALVLRPISARPIRQKEIRKHEQKTGTQVLSSLRKR